MPRRKLNWHGTQKEFDEKIIEYHLDGLRTPKISLLLNVSESSVSRRLRKLGYTLKSQPIEMKIKDVEIKIIILHFLGFSATKISKILGVSIKPITRCMRNIGLTVRMAGKDLYDATRDEYILSEYTSGKSLIKIAKELDTSHEVIKNHLRKMGIVEFRTKKSYVNEYSRDRVGKNNPNWRGGVSTENETIRGSNEMFEWKYKVIGRDNFICQNCGKNGNICAHHIRTFSKYPELRFDVNNGVTLCKMCHREIHSKKYANIEGYYPVNLLRSY